MHWIIISVIIFKGEFMRLRNVKNKEEIMNSSIHLVRNPFDHRGKWSNLFANDNPIYLEIGMGKGDFLIESAKENRDINYIGIEKYDSVIARAIEKVPDDLTNLRLIRGDALDLGEMFSKEIDRIYLNFSDPWPKKRHMNRRLTSHIFLKIYDKVFKNRPEIHQKTDNIDLFAYSIVSLSTYGYTLEEVSLDLHNSDIQNNVMTEYEKRFVKLGHKINYLVAKK